jgi:hypothetical protein
MSTKLIFSVSHISFLFLSPPPPPPPRESVLLSTRFQNDVRQKNIRLQQGKGNSLYCVQPSLAIPRSERTLLLFARVAGWQTMPGDSFV